MPRRNAKSHPRSAARNRREHPRLDLKRIATIGGLITVSLTGMGTVGYMSVKDAQYVQADAAGCFATEQAQAQTVVLADTSDPRFTVAQQRDLMAALEDVFRNRLPFNGRFSVVSTDPSHIGTVLHPVVERCAPAHSSADLEAIGAKPVSQAYLTRQRDEVYQTNVLPALEQVFDLDPPHGQRQGYESPILEQLQSISRREGFANARASRRLIVVSDMLQSTAEAQFCQTKGHLPAFSTFKAKPYFKRVEPESITGVDVQLYVLERSTVGPFCRDLDELLSFWQAYFEEAGAASVRITRLRPSPYVTSSRDE